MKKIALALFALAIAWFLAAPYLAARGLGQALQSGDEKELRAHVDFPALRDNLKEQVYAALKKEVDAAPEDPASLLAAAFMGPLVEPLVDNLVSPQGLSLLIRQDRKKSAASTEAAFADARLSFQGLNEFRITMGPEGEQALHLILVRQGLDWKLSRIEMPLDSVFAGQRAEREREAASSY